MRATRAFPYPNLPRHRSKPPLPGERPGEAWALTAALGRPRSLWACFPAAKQGPLDWVGDHSLEHRVLQGMHWVPQGLGSIPSESTIVLVIMFLQHRIPQNILF